MTMAHDDDTPVFVISVAAELAGMHAQTLRQYDRLGLVSPSRTRGGGRRYSARDVALLREVQRLSQEGVSLAGIQRVADLSSELDAAHASLVSGTRVFAVGRRGEVVTVRPGERPPRPLASQSLVVWRPGTRS